MKKPIIYASVVLLAAIGLAACDSGGVPIRLRIDEFSSVFRFIVRYAEETYAIEGVEAPVELHRTFVFHPTTPLVLPLTIPLAFGAFRVALHRSNLRMRALIAERAGW